MVTLNMESRNPTGRVYAENRSKTQTLLGVKGLIIPLVNTSQQKTGYVMRVT